MGMSCLAIFFAGNLAVIIMMKVVLGKKTFPLKFFAARLPAQEHAGETHEFHFTSFGAVKESLCPELDLQLDTGVANNLQGGTKSSITDEEAVALWDKLVTSIRVGPVGNAAITGSKEAPKVPLGVRVVTGRTCSQTG